MTPRADTFFETHTAYFCADVGCSLLSCAVARSLAYLFQTYHRLLSYLIFWTSQARAQDKRSGRGQASAEAQSASGRRTQRELNDYMI